MCPIISKNDAEWFFRFPPYKCRTVVYCPRWHGHLMREEPWWKVRIHDERRATGLLPSPPPIWAGDQLLPPPTTCMPPMSEPASISWSHKASNFITVLAWMASKLADELTDRVDWSGNPQPLLCSLLSLQPSFLFLFLSFFFFVVVFVVGDWILWYLVLFLEFMLYWTCYNLEKLLLMGLFVCRNGFQTKNKDPNRQSKQLEEHTGKMMVCKRLVLANLC